MKKSKEVVKKESQEITEYSEFFNIDDNMEGCQPRLPAIAITHISQTFVLPDDENVKSIQGIVLHSNRVNAFWEGSFAESGGGNLPDCFSFDGFFPAGNIENPKAEKCSKCKLNEFGSDGKRGKLCKNMRRIHILLEDNLLPYRLTLPPTSLKSWDEYMVSLTNKQIPLPAAITEIELEKTTNADNIVFSCVNFKKVDTIKTKDKLFEVKNMIVKLKEQMQTEDIIADETGIPADENAEGQTKATGKDPF